MGAGVIPVALQSGEVLFLFQRVFSGRKSGYLIDFGGGLADGEIYYETAIREFIEETETMYFSVDPKRAKRTAESVKAQMHVVGNLFEQTMITYPDWWCKRKTFNPLKPKNWRTYFILFPYRDVSTLNKEWQMASKNRFKKRRELVWVPADELLHLCHSEPGKLWKRVRQLEHLGRHVRSISLTLQSDARLTSHRLA